MECSNKNYFSVSELANLFNCSRQAILYYDKHNLLKPKFIDDNGYRYYHFNEYINLEIICNLRRLGFSVEEIKLYLHNRRADLLNKLLYRKRDEYLKDIKLKQMLIDDMRAMLDNINAPLPPVNTIFFKYRPAKEYYAGPKVCKRQNIKQRIHIFGKTNLPIYNTNHFKSFFHSWIIEAKNFKNNLWKEERYYCIPILDDSKLKSNLYMPEGNYLSYAFYGPYQSEVYNFGPKILRYCEQHGLDFVSPFIVIPLVSAWTSSDTKQHVSIIMVCIEKRTP